EGVVELVLDRRARRNVRGVEVGGGKTRDLIGLVDDLRAAISDSPGDLNLKELGEVAFSGSTAVRVELCLITLAAVLNITDVDLETQVGGYVSIVGQIQLVRDGHGRVTRRQRTHTEGPSRGLTNLQFGGTGSGIDRPTGRGEESVGAGAEGDD